MNYRLDFKNSIYRQLLYQRSRIT